jgi:hypothetical protein
MQRAQLMTMLTVAGALLAGSTSAVIAGGDCYWSCSSRCFARYACEQRNAGPNCFTTSTNAGPPAGGNAVTSLLGDVEHCRPDHRGNELQEAIRRHLLSAMAAISTGPSRAC